MNKAEIKKICSKQPEEVTMTEYQNLKLTMLNQLGRTNGMCNGVWCRDCCLSNKGDCSELEVINPQKAIKKVQEWHKENTLKVDWSKVPVDTKIIVWDNSWKNNKIKGHFAKFENGEIYAWNGGITSWSANSYGREQLARWDNAELAEEE